MPPSRPAQASRRTPTARRTPATRRVAASFDGPTPTGRWLRGIHFSGFSLVMMGLLILAVLILAPTVQTLVAQRQQIADQQKAVDDLTSQVSGLKQQRARWNDPSYIRAQARDRLYYVMPGEVSYLVIDDRPPSAKHTDAPVTSRLQKTQSDWVRSLFDSFVGAGLTDATPSELSGHSSGAPTTTSGKQ